MLPMPLECYDPDNVLLPNELVDVWLPRLGPEPFAVLYVIASAFYGNDRLALSLAEIERRSSPDVRNFPRVLRHLQKQA